MVIISFPQSPCFIYSLSLLLFSSFAIYFDSYAYYDGVSFFLAWQERVSVSRHVSPACSSGIAMLIAKGIIGQRIKKYASDVPLSYVMRSCSWTHQPKGRLSHLLPTNAVIIDMLCLTTTRDYIVRSNLCLCGGK